MNKPTMNVKRAQAYEAVKLVARGDWLLFETDGDTATMTKKSGEKVTMAHEEAQVKMAKLIFVDGWRDHLKAN